MGKKPNTVRQWTEEQLGQLGIKPSQQQLEALFALSNPSDSSNFLTALLTQSSQANLQPQLAKNMVTEFVQRRFREASRAHYEVYKKPEADSLAYAPPNSASKKQQPPSLPSDQPSKPKQLNGKDKSGGGGGGGGKAKFAPLDLEKLKEGLLPGRHACKCLAARHKLLTNCLNCGRIVCEQEGPGPCFTCGQALFDQKQQSRIAQRLHDQLLAHGVSKNSLSQAEIQSLLDREQSEKEKAERFKNKLLEFDRSSAKRTRVIDDETDYYSSESNSWLSSKEREKLKSKEAEILAAREKREKEKRLTIDIAGRRVIETTENDDLETHLRERYQEELENLKPAEIESTGYYANHSLSTLNLQPTYVPPPSKEKESGGDKGVKGKERGKKSGGKGRKVPLRVQHDLETSMIDIAEISDVTEEQDPGLCLSMWQPWASLLAYGIKRDEGRSWPTTHRGRLWIAAAAKKPTPDEMNLVIGQHRAQNPPDAIAPKLYPTSCILGCVDVVDCVTQQRYQEMVPDPLLRQSESDYVFICQNPRLLSTPIPASGQHKIWSLAPEVHFECKKLLLPKGVFY